MSSDGPITPQPHIAFYLSDLNPGGVQHAVLRIAAGIASTGCRVSLLVCRMGGKLQAALPASIECVELAATSKLKARIMALRADPAARRLMLHVLFSRRETRTLAHLPALARYLREARPTTLFTATTMPNIEAYLARRLAGVPTRLVISERTYFSAGKPRKEHRRRSLAPLMRRAYAGADHVVAVSHGVADDLVRQIGLAPGHVTVLHNPTIGPDFQARMAEPVDHPWLERGDRPVILTVGRLSLQKDFPTLFAAFAIARAERPLRLVVVGEKNPGEALRIGIDRARKARASLKVDPSIAGDIAFLGFDPNPVRYMARADLFVLSSLFEGFPNVLLEAAAAGCPIVSTDCPSGPYELLDGGRLGRLVPVADPAALARAILAELDRPHDRDALRQRAALFSYERSIEGYRNVLLGLKQDHSYPPPEPRPAFGRSSAAISGGLWRHPVARAADL